MSRIIYRKPDCGYPSSFGSLYIIRIRLREAIRLKLMVKHNMVNGLQESGLLTKNGDSVNVAPREQSTRGWGFRVGYPRRLPLGPPWGGGTGTVVTVMAVAAGQSR